MTPRTSIYSIGCVDGASNGRTEKLNFYNDGPNVLTEYDDNFGYLTRKHIHGTSYVDERAILVDGRTSGVGFDTYYYLLQEVDTVTAGGQERRVA